MAITRWWGSIRRLMRRHERGAAMVEFALILPILVLLLAVIVEVGDAINAYLSVVSASRDGARLIARADATDAEARALVLTDTGRLRDANATDVTITRTTIGSRNAVQVQVCHNHGLVMRYPLLPARDPMRMCAQTTMRLRR